MNYDTDPDINYRNSDPDISFAETDMLKIDPFSNSVLHKLIKPGEYIELQFITRASRQLCGKDQKNMPERQHLHGTLIAYKTNIDKAKTGDPIASIIVRGSFCTPRGTALSPKNNYEIFADEVFGVFTSVDP